jgi:hypothetical protein
MHRTAAGLEGQTNPPESHHSLPSRSPRLPQSMAHWADVIDPADSADRMAPTLSLLVPGVSTHPVTRQSENGVRLSNTRPVLVNAFLS